MSFESKFSGLAEIEAFRAGFKGVKNARDLPNLVPIDTTPTAPTASSRAEDERIIREEMERRLAARAGRLAGR